MDKKNRAIILMVLASFASSCGLMMENAVPGPDSPASIMVSQCMYVAMFSESGSSQETTESSKGLSDKQMETWIMCMAYASTLSDDPLDCAADDLDRFLQESKILPVRGCSGAFVMRE